PHRYADREQPPAAPCIREAAERHAGQRIDDDERGGDRAELLIGEMELPAQRFEHRAESLTVVDVECVDQEEGDERCARAGSHILPSAGGLGGRGVFGSLPAGGGISLGAVPSLRTETEPRLAVMWMLGPSPTRPFNVDVRPSVSFEICGPKSFTTSPR